MRHCVPSWASLVRAAVLTAVLSAGCLLGAAPPAHADCAVMVFGFDPSVGTVVLSPRQLTVSPGGCVTLENNTIFSATFTVGASFRRTAAAFGGTARYDAAAAGTTQSVTASGTAGTAHGAIVIRRRPAPSSGATHSHAPSPRSSPRPKPHASATGTHSTPAPATTAPTPDPGQQRPLESPSRVRSTSGAGPVPSSGPTPGPSSAPAVVAGPLQPPTDRGAGLPGALAALAVVATGGAMLRVLLAEPVGLRAVDDGDSVGAAV